jgi:hypothetical protein
MKAKLFGVIAALALLVSITSTTNAATFTYSLNGSLAEDSNSGPSLVAYGGALTSSGYYFGPNTGLIPIRAARDLPAAPRQAYRASPAV